MSIPAHLTVDGGDSQRASRRRRIRLAAGQVEPGRGARDIVIHDLSPGGCSFAGHDRIAPGTRIRLHIPHAGEVAARTSWVRDARVGCAFDRPLPREALAAALADSRVIWGDFGKREPFMPATATAGVVTRDRRWRGHVAIVIIGLALVAFWGSLAAIV